MANAPGERPLRHLTALIRLLRASGVSRYSTPELTLEFGAPAPVASVEPDPADVEQEELGDPRFALERILAANRRGEQ